MNNRAEIQAILQQRIQVLIQDVATDEGLAAGDKITLILDKLFEMSRENVGAIPQLDNPSVSVKLPGPDSPEIEISIPPDFFNSRDEITL